MFLHFNWLKLYSIIQNAKFIYVIILDTHKLCRKVLGFSLHGNMDNLHLPPKQKGIKLNNSLNFAAQEFKGWGGIMNFIPSCA